jgi:serine/threonine protein kinase
VLPLGAGAFGEVHLAWDGVEGSWVALKRFTGQDELGLLRMVIESRIRVSHPHLVRTLAFHLVDDRAWLVTELARGGSLRALMTRTGALPWGWVAEAVDQILSALTALHATGVIHRDLKPANLLLRSRGDAPPDLLVGDFGIAMWRTVSMTGIGAAIGTPGYLAPEYLDGHQPSPATDLFAVGVLAAEMLTGRRLVHYSNAAPGLPSSWTEVVPIPPEVPAALTTVLQRMAAPHPAHRYRDCAEAREALLSVAPPGTRGDLTRVPVPDLLAALPAGWTPAGPADAKSTPPPLDQPAPPEAESAPNLANLLIDGGPTALVPEHEATVASPTPIAPLIPESGSSTSPLSGSATPLNTSPTGSSTQPPSGSPTTHTTPPTRSATSPDTSPTGSPTQPPSGTPTPHSTSPTGSSTEPPSGSPTTHTTPPTGSATPLPTTPSRGQTAPPQVDQANASPSDPAATSSTPPHTSPTGSPAFPGTPPTGQPAPSPNTPPNSPKAQRKAKRRRKTKQTILALVLLLLAAGAGTLWWAATHRTLPGTPSANGTTSTNQQPTHWTPTITAPCSAVEVAAERPGPNGKERCQRTPTPAQPQNWVEEPPGGFPTSDPDGPFPGERCGNDGDRRYSPVGEHLECRADTWQVMR